MIPAGKVLWLAGRVRELERERDAYRAALGFYSNADRVAHPSDLNTAARALAASPQDRKP